MPAAKVVCCWLCNDGRRWSVQMTRWSRLVPYLQVAPLTVVLLVFLGAPLAVVVAVSFFDYDDFTVYPAFLLRNYLEVFGSGLTYTLYLKTLQFAAVVWALTLVMGLMVAYFLVFHVRTFLWRMALLLLCTVPFWTSNIIRMIAWIPFLGLNGVFNQSLLALGLIDAPLEFLLFSDVAVVIAYVHLLTLFMIVPIVNAMARIDPAVIEAAVDAGASSWRVISDIVLPLSKSGMALGSIFVITLVMGDFFVVKIMSGGQSASVVLAMSNEIALLQYPPAAASAVVLVIIVVAMVAAILRLVDVQKELSGRGGATVMQQQSAGTRPWTFYAMAAGFTLFVVFLYGPMFAIYLLSFQGPNGGLTFPMHGVSLHWFTALFAQQRTGDVAGAFLRSLVLAQLVLVLTVVMAVMAGLAFRRRFVGAALVFYLAIASLVMPGLLVGLGIGLMCQLLGVQPAWYASALGAQLTWTLPFGLLIMFAVFSRFNPFYEEAARDLGASAWQTLRYVVLPILLPGIIGVALFGFTLSYDEFARTLLTVGPRNTLPLEIWAMTTNVTSPSLYALGTLTTAVSFVVIALALLSMALIQRRRARQSLHAQRGSDPS
jgi:ABC-type spermidine/putrescine transport system permease subunit II